MGVRARFQFTRSVEAFQAEKGKIDSTVSGVKRCKLPVWFLAAIRLDASVSPDVLSEGSTEYKGFVAQLR